MGKGWPACSGELLKPITNMDSSSFDDDSDSSSAESARNNKPLLALDPEAVRALGASAGCQELIGEPPLDERSHLLHHATTTSSSYDNNSTLFTEGKRHNKKEDDEHILSFLAFDPLSVEQLAAEAGGKENKTGEFGGVGVARVDVYCLTGTVMVSRVMIAPNIYDNNSVVQDELSENQVVINHAIRSSEDHINDSNKVEGDDDNNIQNTRIRRIIRRKCTPETLRCIFSNPHKFTTIDESLFTPINNHNDTEEVDDEMARQHVANAIINAAINGIGGDDLERVMQLETIINSNNYPAASDNNGEDERRRMDDLLSAQVEIRNKIEIADIGLAILMGEKERLEKMMDMNNTTEKVEQKKSPRQLDTEGQNSTDHSDDDDDDDSDSDSEDDSTAASESTRNAELLDLPVEYSFPSDMADTLEEALLGHSTNDDESTDSILPRRRRSKTARKIHPDDIRQKKRRLGISAITSIPTNGEGCVILRENGAFNVVGDIPRKLEERLFDRDGPFPEYISLGSNDRYFVKFDDGTYYFYGPDSMATILEKRMPQRQRGKGKKKRRGGKSSNLSVASVAFGREIEDFFVVFTDGSWECDGFLHKGLDKLLDDRGNLADLLWVSLGPDNQWCLKARNGRVWWSGVSDEISEALFDITDARETDVKYISFGVDDSYFLLFDHR